jgi:stress response protein YsnF
VKTDTGWDISVPVRRGTFRVQKRVVAASEVIARRRVVADDFTFEATTLHEEPFVEDADAVREAASAEANPPQR